MRGRQRPSRSSSFAAGCGTPGGDEGDNAEKAEESNANAAKVDVSKAGDVTLTVWDQEVRGGQARQIKRLNEQFQSEYPNVKIERVAKTFNDLNTTLKLAVSGPKAPDIVQANQGRGVMGQLVKGGLLAPMDSYADAYGWGDRWAKTLLDLNRFSPDGGTFGSGSLFGVSQMGEIVGVFYNKDKVASPPKTFAEFEQMLEQAKQDGDVPISFGALDKFGAIHEYQTVQNQYVDKQAVRDFVFAKEGASFATAENEEAAAKLQDWAEAGYVTPDFNGTSYDAAWQQFAKGRGPFLIGGTWLIADLASAMGENVGFFLMPRPEEGEAPVSLGGESLPWAITAKLEERRRGGGLHRPPDRRGGRRGAGRDRQPAGDGDRRRAAGLAQQGGVRRLAGAQRGRRVHAVHRLRDGDVLRRLLGGRPAADGRAARGARVRGRGAGRLRQVM